MDRKVAFWYQCFIYFHSWLLKCGHYKAPSLVYKKVHELQKSNFMWQFDGTRVFSLIQSSVVATYMGT